MRGEYGAREQCGKVCRVGDSDEAEHGELQQILRVRVVAKDGEWGQRKDASERINLERKPKQ